MKLLRDVTLALGYAVIGFGLAAMPSLADGPSVAPETKFVFGCEVKPIENSNAFQTVVPGCLTGWQKRAGIYGDPGQDRLAEEREKEREESANTPEPSTPAPSAPESSPGDVAGNPGNDKPVGGAGENPSGKDKT